VIKLQFDFVCLFKTLAFHNLLINTIPKKDLKKESCSVPNRQNTHMQLYHMLSEKKKNYLDDLMHKKNKIILFTTPNYRSIEVVAYDIALQNIFLNLSNFLDN
jgi:hypothetical protein